MVRSKNYCMTNENYKKSQDVRPSARSLAGKLKSDKGKGHTLSQIREIAAENFVKKLKRRGGI